MRIPQKDFGCRFFLSALNSQPMLDSQAAHSAIVHVYLQQKKKELNQCTQISENQLKKCYTLETSCEFWTGHHAVQGL